MRFPRFPILPPRIHAMRSPAVTQADLALVGWAVVCAAAASYAEVKAGAIRSLSFGLSPAGVVGLVFLAGLLAGLAVRRFLLRWDFWFVTDERSYFFIDAGKGALFCPRASIRTVRHQADGIVLDLGDRVEHVDEAPAVLLLAVHGLLERWALEGQPPRQPG